MLLGAQDFLREAQLFAMCSDRSAYSFTKYHNIPKSDVLCFESGYLVCYLGSPPPLYTLPSFCLRDSAPNTWIMIVFHFCMLVYLRVSEHICAYLWFDERRECH